GVGKPLVSAGQPAGIPLQGRHWLLVAELYGYVGHRRSLGKMDAGERVPQVVEPMPRELCAAHGGEKALTDARLVEAAAGSIHKHELRKLPATQSQRLTLALPAEPA